VTSMHFSTKSLLLPFISNHLISPITTPFPKMDFEFWPQRWKLWPLSLVLSLKLTLSSLLNVFLSLKNWTSTFLKRSIGIQIYCHWHFPNYARLISQVIAFFLHNCYIIKACIAFMIERNEINLNLNLKFRAFGTATPQSMSITL
jgi:hypothetical protein